MGLVRLGENSRLKLGDLSSQGRLNIQLQKGRAGFLMKRLKPNSEFRVSTPTVVASVRGTSFLVGIDSTESGSPAGAADDSEGPVISKVAMFDGALELGAPDLNDDESETPEPPTILDRPGEVRLKTGDRISPASIQPLSAESIAEMKALEEMTSPAGTGASRRGHDSPRPGRNRSARNSAAATGTMKLVLNDSRKNPVAYAVLLGSVLLTLMVWIYWQGLEKREARSRSSARIQVEKESIQLRLRSFLENLRALRSLAHATPGVDRERWNAFIRDLEITDRFAGIDSLVYYRTRAGAGEANQPGDELRIVWLHDLGANAITADAAGANRLSADCADARARAIRETRATGEPRAFCLKTPLNPDSDQLEIVLADRVGAGTAAAAPAGEYDCGHSLFVHRSARRSVRR